MNALLKYPHIERQITDLWGTPRLTAYVSNLLLIENRVTRIGFSPEAFSELLFILETHKMIYGY